METCPPAGDDGRPAPCRLASRDDGGLRRAESRHRGSTVSASSRPAGPCVFIGGEWLETKDTYEVVNPATERPIGEAPDADAGLATAAAEAADAALAGWFGTAPEARAAVLNGAAEYLVEHGTEVVRLAQAEHGCTMASATGFHLGGTVDRLRQFALGALEPTTIPIPPARASGASPSASGGGLVTAVAHRQPVGVVACITPYNAPMANTAAKVGPALAMGNTVIVKPAPQDPLAVLVLAEAFAAAGLPAGVLNVVTESGSDAGKALVDSPLVNMISFTGSTAVGSGIARQAAGSMKRLLMELGERVQLLYSQTPTSSSLPLGSPAPGRSTPDRSAPRQAEWWCTDPFTTNS